MIFSGSPETSASISSLVGRPGTATALWPSVTSRGGPSGKLNFATKNPSPAQFLVSGTDVQNSVIPNTGSDINGSSLNVIDWSNL